jgi:hypothetical protein
MGTALNYVALRLLGVPAEHPVIIQARATLHRLGERDYSPREAMSIIYNSFKVAPLPQRRGANFGFRS